MVSLKVKVQSRHSRGFLARVVVLSLYSTLVCSAFSAHIREERVVGLCWDGQGGITARHEALPDLGRLGSVGSVGKASA